jgi:uncharacterized membrane protein
MRYARFFFVAFALACGSFATTAPALAAGTSLHICNHGSLKVTITAGYFSPGPDDDPGTLYGPFVSRGWWQIEPGDCKSIANPFSARYFWWWGYDSNEYFDGSATASDRYYCVPNPAVASSSFAFEDENRSESDCTSGHFATDGSANRWVNARKVDVEVDPDVTIT